MWQKIKKSTDLLAVLSCLLFLLVTSLLPNVKSFFALSFVFLFFLTWRYSFSKAIIYVAPILTTLWIGQSHSTLVVPAKAIVVHQYFEGRHLSWTFTPYLMIATVALLLIPFWQRIYKNKVKLLIHEKLIIIVAASGFLSAIYGAVLLEISLFFVFNSFLSVIWAYYLILLKNNLNKKEFYRLLTTFLFIWLILVNYESILVLAQVLFKRPIGLIVETTKTAPIFGLGADEGSGGFRPFGLAYHPNGLANKHLIYIFLLAFIKFYLKKLAAPFKDFVNWTILGSIVVIFLSLSRAAYLALIISALFVCFRHPKFFNDQFSNWKKKLTKTSRAHRFLFLLIALFLFSKFSSRLLNSIYSFSDWGGFSTRLIQYQEAWEIFKKSPFLGIGDQMFVPIAYQLFPKGVVSYFPENVHQGFLLFMIERGIFGLLVYLLFFYYFLKHLIKLDAISSINKTMLYSGIIGSFIIMLFHPERNLLNTLFLIGVSLTHYEKKTI